MNKGLLFVLSAPSGCGKTTIVKRVMAALPELVFSVSHTTREPRPGEVDGKNYHFVDESTFRQLSQQEPTAFLEWAQVHGNFYGTSRDEVLRQQQLGKDVILDIDVQGTRQVQRNASPVTVFIAPPSLEELEFRLRKRGTESEETIALRLANAKEEMKAVDDYQYLIVNDRLEEAVESLRSIFIAERSRQRRSLSGEPVRLVF